MSRKKKEEKIVRESFVFYRSFYEAVSTLEGMDKVALIEKICHYALDGEITEDENNVANALFILIKPLIDANNRRYLNGKKGGAPLHNKNAKRKIKQTIVTTETIESNGSEETEEKKEVETDEDNE